MEQSKVLKFVSFTSTVNTSFWKTFTEIKLNVDKLCQEEKPIWGKYSNNNSSRTSQVYFELDSTSFNNECHYQNMELPSRGYLLNKNVIEDFKNCNKRELVQEFGEKILRCWANGEPFKNPTLLNNFIVLSFADLKNYKYYYWFCFPTPLLSVGISVESISSLKEVFSDDLMKNLYSEYSQLNVQQKSFFILKSNKVTELCNMKELTSESNLEDYIFAFSDPSKSTEHPGWVLNNYISFIFLQCPFLLGKNLKFLALRLSLENHKYTCKESMIFTVNVPSFNIQHWIGWEKNNKGKLLPRISSLKNSMDPKVLAESAADLNLKLMTWRELPNLNLKIIKETKYLVLGAKKLGWSVASTILAWGARHITFLDDSETETAAENLKKIFPGVNSQGHNLNIPELGTSPPNDLTETKENVQTLIKLLIEHDVVFISLNSYKKMWLPTFLCSFYNKCSTLFKERELLNQANKTLLCMDRSALVDLSIIYKFAITLTEGCNTYYIIRQGVNPTDISQREVTSGTSDTPAHELSCYYCAEHTTMESRSKQQIHGISQISGAIAAELAISILLHSKGFLAPSYISVDNFTEESILGILPHAIQGCPSNFDNVSVSTTRRNPKCIACSEIAKEEYRLNGFSFLIKYVAGFDFLPNFKSFLHLPTLNTLVDSESEASMEKVRNAKCLLLGSGTLGSSVALTLVEWGVKHITFVDNSNVSYSNPVRQNLFTFENCTQTKSKAIAAAENLKKLYPDIVTKGHKLAIPMPGHQIGASVMEETKQNVETLTELVKEHDVIFLLMDSRESRWLPTLLGTYYKKITINAALGFNSYLVMRHGIFSPELNLEDLPAPDGYRTIPGEMLGCYFCSDVTAPGNSSKNRSLDQQCTVTRPGVSKIAGALATLLTVFALQHPKGCLAPASYREFPFAADLTSADKLNFNFLTHSIRGFLTDYDSLFITVPKFSNCIACSELIIKNYAENGFNFLLRAFDSCKTLEDITGISSLCPESLNLDDMAMGSEFDSDV